MFKICCLKRFTSDVRTHTDRKWSAGKNVSCKRKPKKAGVAIHISDKIDFKTKIVIKDKDGHYINDKGSIQQEDIIFVNIYAPNIKSPKYIKQILTDLKKEIHKNTIIIGGFNTPLNQWIDHPTENQ